MTTDTAARRARLGERACRHAEQVVAKAPPLSAEALAALTALTRARATTTDKAA